RQLRLGEGDERRRRHTKQDAGEGDDLMRRRRLVVAEIVGRPGIGPRKGGFERGGDVLDMDAREDLAGLVDALRPAGAHGIERAAPRAVDAGEAEDMQREAGSVMEAPPARFGNEPAAAALAARLQRRSLVDEATAAIA